MKNSLEWMILCRLVYDERFSRKALPHIKENYFDEFTEKFIFRLVETFFNRYNKLPTKEALQIILQKSKNLSEAEFKDVESYIDSLEDVEVDERWIVDETETWCKDSAVKNALYRCIDIMQNEKGSLSEGAMPKLLQDALSVGFDANIGHNYIEDFPKRFEFYHQKEEKLAFDVKLLNQITDGGLSRKTLNVIMAGTGVGKSLSSCHFASSYITDGKNVLYITLEMAEEKIAQRIDANLMDVPIGDIESLSERNYKALSEKVRKKVLGKLYIKEYPTAMANVNHFRHLLEELKLKKNFVPDVIIVDYLNIMSSSRVKGDTGSYYLVKSIAEELRGLAVEFDVPVITSTQTNRSGFSRSDPGLEDISESFGTPMTADLLIAIITNENLEKVGQFRIKQLKNRYGDLSRYNSFCVGVDKPKMRLYDVEQNTTGDEQLKEEKPKRKKLTKSPFDFSE